jgi:hypothetical protein
MSDLADFAVDDSSQLALVNGRGVRGTLAASSFQPARALGAALVTASLSAYVVPFNKGRALRTLAYG